MVIMVGSILLHSGCAFIRRHLPASPTSVMANGVSLSHDPSVKSAPAVHSDIGDQTIPIPAGSVVHVNETESIPATQTMAFVPSKKEITFELPKDSGTSIFTKYVKVDANGSSGFEPPKGPTPTEQANAWWTYVGVGITALGLFFCTPWGGGNMRVGAIIAAGGIGMALVGKFIDQIHIPTPALFLIFPVIAVAVYYGYRVRHKQVTTVTVPAPDEIPKIPIV